MLVGSPHGIYRVVHEAFDGLDDFFCSAVTIPGQVQRAASERVDE